MTGYYSLKNAKVFHFLPAGGSGNFNVDLKFVTIEVVATMRSTNNSLNLRKVTNPLDDPHSTTTIPFLTLNDKHKYIHAILIRIPR